MSEFDVLEFDPSRVQAGELFPSAIERDPWVMFHGTSSNSAESIEIHGFTYANHPVRAEDVESMSQIFLDMGWTGNDPGGFGVLHAFSKSDLTGNDSRIFFGETGSRGLLYATQDFSGGEKMRAIRRSWRDLERFLADDSIREVHCTGHQRRLSVPRIIGVAANAEEVVAEADLDWLKTRMQELRDIADISFEAERAHEFGVVYAVRFDETYLDLLSYSGSMGLSAGALVPASCIIAKMEIPRSFDEKFASRLASDWYIEKISSGLVGRMKSCHPKEPI